ncbi:alpha/beta hydrolase fold domain-containing protein [Rhodovibrionaceae bacterium A322]
MSFADMVFAEGIEEYIRQSEAAFPPDFAEQSLDQQRALYAKLCQTFETGRPDGMAVTDQAIVLEDRSIPIRIYRPEGVSDHAAPGILYFHGGGNVFGDLDSHDGITAELAQKTGAVLVAVNYRLAPENCHPAASDDCWAAYQWLFEKAETLGLDPARIILAGDSAGGNLAMGQLFRARKEKAARVVGAVLIYPGFGLAYAVPDHPTGPDAPGLTKDEMAYYKELYLGPGVAPDARASPLLETDYSGLPSVYIQAAEQDPVSRDGEVMAARIRAAGGHCDYLVFPGLIHGHLRARRSVPMAGKAFESAVEAARNFLE